MNRITSTEFQQNVGSYSDTALQAPVIITAHNRDRLVLMGMEEFNRLKELEDAMSAKTEDLMDSRVAVHRETLEKLALR